MRNNASLFNVPSSFLKETNGIPGSEIAVTNNVKRPSGPPNISNTE